MLPARAEACAHASLQGGGCFIGFTSAMGRFVRFILGLRGFIGFTSAQGRYVSFILGLRGFIGFDTSSFKKRRITLLRVPHAARVSRFISFYT